MVAKKKRTQENETLERILRFMFLAWVIGILCGGGLYHIFGNTFEEGKQGVYNLELDKTTIYHDRFDLQVFPHVAFHELGHHIWYKRLNESQRLEFAGYYNHNPQSVTEYGATDASEDFAERYAHSIICRWYEPQTDNEQKDAFIAQTHIENQVVLSHQMWGIR
jgi:hypothetical protein